MNSPVRVATITLNPAIDQTLAIPNFYADAVNRVSWEQADAGGKGVNVAAFLAGYFESVDRACSITATGFLGADNTGIFEQLFQQERIRDRFVHVPGKTRVNIKIVDDAQSQITDINFPGMTVKARDLETLSEAITSLTPDTDWFVFSGSLPPGLPATAYRDLIKPLKAEGKHVVLDTSGDALKDALLAQPSVIKPNTEELSGLLGRSLTSETEIFTAAREMVASGVETVVVSMGSEGALFVTAQAIVHAYAQPSEIKSTVGAGDAMVAGTVAGMSQGRSLADCARLATAFSITALGQLGAHFPADTDWERLCDRVSIRTLSSL